MKHVSPWWLFVLAISAMLAAGACDGDDNDPNRDPNFRASPTCGNGRMDNPAEQCDDGNTRNGDGCSAQCTVEGACGNGDVESSEECDPAAPATQCGGNAACSMFCVCGNYCGDGRIGGTEQCDDGNAGTGDGCRPNCTLEICGDVLAGMIGGLLGQQISAFQATLLGI